MLFVQDNLVIPESDLSFFTAKSGGPGGQHVNTTNSRICVRFNIRTASCLSKGQSEILSLRLGRRLTKDGDLILCSTGSRSQHANKQEVLDRLAATLQYALKPRRKRVATKVPKGARERRLKHKRKRSLVKQHRSRVRVDE